jgi:hypothetical protein
VLAGKKSSLRSWAARWKYQQCWWWKCDDFAKSCDWQTVSSFLALKYCSGHPTRHSPRTTLIGCSSTTCSAQVTAHMSPWPFQNWLDEEGMRNVALSTESTLWANMIMYAVVCTLFVGKFAGRATNSFPLSSSLDLRIKFYLDTWLFDPQCQAFQARKRVLLGAAVLDPLKWAATTWEERTTFLHKTSRERREFFYFSLMHIMGGFCSQTIATLAIAWHRAWTNWRQCKLEIIFLSVSACYRWRQEKKTHEMLCLPRFETGAILCARLAFSPEATYKAEKNPLGGFLCHSNGWAAKVRRFAGHK